MRVNMIAASLIAAFATLPAFAEDAAAPAVAADAAAPAAAPASPIVGNFAIVSDYRFRGISQTYKQPAVQGGLDYTHSSGAYAGTWMSNVSGNSYNNGASLEWDLYGGYRQTIVDKLGFDVGGLYYYYPGAFYTADGKTKYNNFETYAALTYDWASLKYSYAVTNFFGTKTATAGAFGSGDSKGSGYLDLSANIPLMDKLTFNAHVGHQSVKHYNKMAYTDWKAGLTYDLTGWQVGAAIVGTNARDEVYTTCDTTGGHCKKTGTNTLVLSVGKSF